jgi:hypothetical protein
MFTAMIEKADIVVAIFDRLDFAFNKFVKGGEIIGDFRRYFKNHNALPYITDALSLHHRANIRLFRIAPFRGM